MRLFVFVLAAGVALAEPRIVSIKKIWDQGKHNAFTDLMRFRGVFYCTFRESDDHVGGDGKIRVLRSKDGEAWEPAALIEETGIDLRDPKLSMTPDRRMMIVAGGSVYQGTRTLKSRQPRVMFSRDGKSWTKPHPVLAPGDWLWRVTWFKGHAYGVSYDHTAAPDWTIKLYKSANGLQWSLVTQLQVPGHPNETTVRFLPDGRMVALVRREADDKKAWIGNSPAPYKKWKWAPAGYQFGGPNFIVLPDARIIAGGRDYRGSPANKTSIGPMSLEGYAPQLSFPSSGDNSYPGFLWYRGLLWMSYYSSHEGKTSVYLAKVELK